MFALGRRQALSHAPRWVQFGGPRLLGSSPQPIGANWFDYNCRNLAILEIGVMTLGKSRIHLLRNLTATMSDLNGPVHPFITALTGAWNGRAREKYLVDPFPRDPPGVCYHAHLVVIYSFLNLRIFLLAPLLSICMQSHLRLALHDKPASRAIEWRAVISPKMLPEYSSITYPR